jgi:hypothetical protein
VSERITNVSVVLRVDTDRCRRECVINVPDGAPPLETAVLIQQTLDTFGGDLWHKVPRLEILSIVKTALQKAHRERSDGGGWTLNWLLHDLDVEVLAKTIADEIEQEASR